MQYGSQRQTGQQPPSSQSLGAPQQHPPSAQVIYTHGPLTAAPQRPLVHCSRRHPQPRAIYATQVPVMQYQYNQRQPPSTVPYIQAAPSPGAVPYQYQPVNPTAYQFSSPYFIQAAPGGNIHTRGPPVPIQMGHAGHPQPPQTQTSSHTQTAPRNTKSRPNAIAIINPTTLKEVCVEDKDQDHQQQEEEATPVVSAICDGPSVEIPLEPGRRKV